MGRSCLLPRLGVLALMVGVALEAGCTNTKHPKEAATDAMSAGNPKRTATMFAEGDGMSLKQALVKRRSIRSFRSRSLLDRELLALLFAAQGITSEKGLRAAPSAGATYPLEIHVVTRKGVLQYTPETHSVTALSSENRMAALSDAALGQRCVAEAAANFVFGGVLERTAQRYGERAVRYVDIEAGCAAQNLMLMATSLGLGSVMVGAHDDQKVGQIAEFPSNCSPIVMAAVGVAK
jgi:SagB-type dehydrogenase family enzyme